MTPLHFRRLQTGRQRYQQKRTELVKEKEKRLIQEGIDEVGSLSKRDLFLSGIALYWAEGFKHPKESRLGFATSDPAMAKFYVLWIQRCLKTPKASLALRVTVNISHQHRIHHIERYWSDALSIPKTQFTRPFFQRTKWKKRFDNERTYAGVIRIHVSKSLDVLRKMRGWIEGIKSTAVRTG